MNKLITCEHVCSGNCRRIGCNCECGEFHQEAVSLEVKHLPSDYPKNTVWSPIAVCKECGDKWLWAVENNQDFLCPTCQVIHDQDEGDRTAADYADSEPTNEEVYPDQAYA